MQAEQAASRASQELELLSTQVAAGGKEKVRGGRKEERREERLAGERDREGLCVWLRKEGVEGEREGGRDREGHLPATNRRCRDFSG